MVFVRDSDYMFVTILIEPIQVDQNPVESDKYQIYVPDFQYSSKVIMFI